MILIDLSHPFDPELQPDPGPTGLRLERLKTVAHDGVNTMYIGLGNHIGTHIDAPLHLIEEGAAVDELPLDTYYGTAAVLDLRREQNEGVTAQDLAGAKPTVEPGDIVVIHSGWGDRLGTPQYASHHPYLTDDAAHWLVRSGVRLVAMDVQSVDLPHSLRPPGFRYTSLRTLLAAGIPVAHSLTNLEPVAGRRVQVFCLPVNFRGADGAPVRIVAQVD